MASTYVNDLRLNEMATGDASGSWGTVTNTNLELIGEAFSYGTETIGDADSTLTIADGAADAARSFYLKITSSVDLTTTRIVTLGPNTVSKVWMIENATTGSQVITIKQGSGATINVPNGQVKMISTDGAGSGGAVLDLLVDVDLTGTTTLVNLDVSGTALVTGVLTTTAATVFNGGFTANADSTLGTDKKVQFRDAAIYINSSVDGQLDIVADTEIQIAATTVDLNGALDVSGTALVTGVLTTTAATVSNGGGQFNGAINVGVDDTGYDVKFFGATTGKSLLWDESADSLIVTGTTTLVGTTNLDAVDIDGATQIDATVTVGVDDTGYDVKFFGATAGAYMLWDESADTLEVSGTVVADGLTVSTTLGDTPASIVTTTGGSFLQFTDVNTTAGRSPLVGAITDGLSFYTSAGSYSQKLGIDSLGGITGTSQAGGHVVFNEGGIDADFRVESATTANALFVQGSDGFVGIGTTPATKLDVLGSINSGVRVSDGTATGIIYASSEATNSIVVGTTTNHPLVLYTNNAPRMTIDPSGGLITNPAAGGHAVFNEGGIDADFRVESDGNTHALFVEGGTNRVGIGTSGPTTTLDISGVLRLGGTAEGDQGTQLNLYSDASGNGYIAVYQLAINTGANNSRTQALLINSSGDVTIAGALSKGSGSFRIPHPLKPETHELVHSFIEGPQADNIYRGKVTLVDGSATVNIDSVSGMSEGTYVLLNTNTQCFTSNESGWTAVKGSVSGNILTIEAQESCSDTISWMVVGERHDQHMLDTEWTDENGKVIVEPLKELES
jgi:hypothetical protein